MSRGNVVYDIYCFKLRSLSKENLSDTVAALGELGSRLLDDVFRSRC